MEKQTKTPYRTSIQAAEYLCLKPKTLRNMRWRGQGPRYRKHGSKVVYHVDELDKWSEERGLGAGTKAG